MEVRPESPRGARLNECAGRRRAGNRVQPAEYDQGSEPGTAAQPRALSTRRARSPSAPPHHRHSGHCPPLTHAPVPDRPQARERVSIGEGSPMRGCKASPLRDPRRERRTRQPDHRPRVRLSEPPRQESGAGLSACHRARTPGRPRSRRVDGCQRELSPRTVATPVGRNRQPSVRQGDGLRRSALSQRVRGPRAMTLLHRSRADGARIVLGRAGFRLPIRSTCWRTSRARRNPPGCARSR